jgi:hypothetical protein
VPKVPLSFHLFHLFLIHFLSSFFFFFFFSLFFFEFLFFYFLQMDGPGGWSSLLSAIGAPRGQRTVVLGVLAVVGVHVRPVDLASLACHVGQQLD